jgi:hypothetical protein
MLNDFLKLLRGVSVVVGLYCLHRAFFAEFGSASPLLASGSTQSIVLYGLLFLGFGFYAAIDDGEWAFNSFALLMVITLISLLFPTLDVLSFQHSEGVSSGLFLKSFIALVVALAGSFVGSQFRTAARHWRAFDHRLTKAKQGARGLHTFWKGQRSLLDWFRYLVVFVGVILGAFAYVVFQLGVAVFGRGVVPELMVIGYVVFAFYVLVLGVSWFRCSSNVSAPRWKYLAHVVGFIGFALVIGWSLPMLNTAMLVNQYVN